MIPSVVVNEIYLSLYMYTYWEKFCTYFNLVSLILSLN
jgi:hypothetical protein